MSDPKVLTVSSPQKILFQSDNNKQRANNLLNKMLAELAKLEKDQSTKHVAYIKRGEVVYGK